MEPIGRTTNSEDYVEWLQQIDAIGGEFNWIKKAKDFPKKTDSDERTSAEINVSVLKSKNVQNAVFEEAKRRNCDVKQVQLEARDIVRDMAQDCGLSYVRIVGYGVIKVVKRLFQEVHVNFGLLKKLRERVARDSIVFVPTHKTYADFLILSLLCYHEDVTLPAIAAGEDFKQSRFMGEALRRCGAFFMRRSFGQDKLYWAVFSEYVQTHVINNDRPVEFFVEGTRSRTGKSLHPKYGFLQMVLEPYLKCQVYDLMIVPVTMNYDKVFEESLYAYELLGFQKPKETASGLLKARHILDQNFGRVYVTFAQPISIRQMLEPRIDRLSLSFLPNKEFVLDPTTRHVVRKFGHEIVKIHNQHNVIGIWPLACLAFGEIIEDSTLTVKDVVKIEYSKLQQKTAQIHTLCKRLMIQIQMHESVDKDLRSLLNFHSDLFQPFDTSKNDFYLVPTEMVVDKDTFVSKKVLQKAVTEIIFDNYSNQVMSFFNELGYLAVSMKSMESEGMTIERLKEEFRFLQQLFVREFIFVPGETDNNFFAAFRRLKAAGIIKMMGNTVVSERPGDLNQLAAILTPYIRSYLTSFKVLFDNHHRIHLYTPKSVIPLIQRELAGMVVNEPYNASALRLFFLSSELIKNAFHFLTDNRIITKKPWHSLEMDLSKMDKCYKRLALFDEALPAESLANVTALRSRL